ncbi:MAG: DUF3261 domain-containing protein [Sphaerochaetaceae bacterium]|nr:DUF3261 domain-containing protein [Sphaerochaetaceae bacterium]
MKIAAVLLTVLVFLTSCSTVRFNITDEKRINLFPLVSEANKTETFLLVTGSFPSIGELTAQAWLETDSSGLSLTVMLPTGQTLMQIYYNGKKTTVSPSSAKTVMFAPYVVADVQLCFTPSAVIEENLVANGLRYEETQENEDITRCIYDGDKLVICVKIHQNVFQVKNILRGYEYTAEILY